MIQNIYILVLVLLSIEIIVLSLASNPRTKFLFKIIPSMFWIYFLPMVLSTCGLIDAKSPVYAGITRIFLPPALFLLLLKVDLKAILRLGPRALAMFLAGSFGIVLGVVLVFALFKPLIGASFWSGFGALSASWTGGSANMIAVKEALNTPDAVFMPMVIVDTVVPYTWLAILMALAGRQRDFDLWNRSDRRILDDLNHALAATAAKRGARKQSLSGMHLVSILVLAFLIGYVCRQVSVYLPTGKDIMSPYAWTVILASAMAIFCSMTPIGRMPQNETHTWGKWILYFVLTSIGARASLHHAAQVGALIAAGFLILAVHILILTGFARWLRAPMFLAATASMANIAGLVSAPMVAEIYQPGFASVGLLLAILGHSLGAYIGIFTGQICRWLAQ